MGFIQGFLAKAFQTVGLSVLANASKDVPAVLYGGALLIIAMFYYAITFLIHGNVAQAFVTLIVFIFILLILCLIANKKNTTQQNVLSWIIIVTLGFMMVIISLSFAFQVPRPIDQLLLVSPKVPDINNLKVKLERDLSGKIIVSTESAPKQPYWIEIQVTEKDSNRLIDTLNLPLAELNDNSNPSGTLNKNISVEKVDCIVNVKYNNETLSTRKLECPINSVKE